MAIATRRNLFSNVRPIADQQSRALAQQAAIEPAYRAPIRSTGGGSFAFPSFGRDPALFPSAATPAAPPVVPSGGGGETPAGVRGVPEARVESMNSEGGLGAGSSPLGEYPGGIGGPQPDMTNDPWGMARGVARGVTAVLGGLPGMAIAGGLTVADPNTKSYGLLDYIGRDLGITGSGGTKAEVPANTSGTDVAIGNTSPTGKPGPTDQTAPQAIPGPTIGFGDDGGKPGTGEIGGNIGGDMSGGDLGSKGDYGGAPAEGGAKGGEGPGGGGMGGEDGGSKGDAADGGSKWQSGGYTGPGAPTKPAGTVHAGEYVLNQPATNAIASQHGMGALDYANQTGDLPGVTPEEIAQRAAMLPPGTITPEVEAILAELLGPEFAGVFDSATMMGGGAPAPAPGGMAPQRPQMPQEEMMPGFMGGGRVPQRPGYMNGGLVRSARPNPYPFDRRSWSNRNVDSRQREHATVPIPTIQHPDGPQGGGRAMVVDPWQRRIEESPKFKGARKGLEGIRT